MPKILTGQTLVLENVLSYRFTASQDKMESYFVSVDDFLKKNKLVRGNPVVTSTLGGQVINGIQFLDMKMIIPIGERFESNEKFEYLSEFKIENALKITHIGNPNDIMGTVQQLIGYITDHKLEPNTSVYNVSFGKSDASAEIDLNSVITDMYIGIRMCERHETIE
jgi:effector-binding domain-containing protein